MASLHFLNPSIGEQAQIDKRALQVKAEEARAKLTKFQRMADPNNVEIMSALQEMQRHTEALERNAKQEILVPEDPDAVDRVSVNAKDSSGFYIP
mmetsp:Transcript_11701/g.15898  ORF Transcript_11701/g.15898 Transcript_11701/m.15898 type:complete len:95 (+) Transcript_11701:229-513(+)|eukprot:CAMPEP_0196580050 /NCGR_PEP_ID=MMETSP1081-20130531/26623_1 /TAXON_ID=36882 /ORGANISM="Pyramimonas amylifera, Strain CCMP720" /LENGTH=94 /DNA_ID=CAMNT_0041899815 /DNA_START=229 /DNA_END=513 /DNA_ORIENTATION=+